MPDFVVGRTLGFQHKYMHVCIALIWVTRLVRVISISDEVYFELSKMKNGKSFTQLLKALIEQCENKGDPEKILEFLNTHEPISEEEAQRMITEIEEGRKRAVPRKIFIE